MDKINSCKQRYFYQRLQAQSMPVDSNRVEIPLFLFAALIDKLLAVEFITQVAARYKRPVVFYDRYIQHLFIPG